MTEAKRTARRFWLWSSLAAGLSISFPPLAAVAIPVGIVLAIRHAGRKRREAQIKPTRFVPEQAYNNVPVELRGRM